MAGAAGGGPLLAPEDLAGFMSCWPGCRQADEAHPRPLDERILAELTANARIAHAELGLKVNLSRNAVRQRIERLERDGAIQGYTLRIGEGAGRRR